MNYVGLRIDRPSKRVYYDNGSQPDCIYFSTQNKMKPIPSCSWTTTLLTAGKDPITYELIVHILGEEIEHEDEFENLMS